MSVVEIRSILYPTDFSSCSAIALPHAKHLAERLGIPLDVLYVHEAGGAPGTEDTILAQRLSRYLEHQGLTEVVRQVLVRYGRPAEQILHAAEEISAGLIVMGTHGRTGFSSVLMGSVTQRVLREACCPVYVVSGTAPGSRPPMIREEEPADPDRPGTARAG